MTGIPSPPAQGLIQLPPLPESPLVSVLVSSYNRENFVGEAVRSVLRQTYRNLEIIVCDDGSTDRSVDVLRALAESDSRLTVFSEANAGQCAALNAAFARSRGQIACLLDSDDLFEPGKIENVVRKFQSDSRFGTVMNAIRLIDSNGNSIREIAVKHEGYLGPIMFILRKGHIATQSSGLSFRREILDAILPLPEQLPVAADGAISGPAINLAATGTISAVLSCWRLHGANFDGAMSHQSRLTGEHFERTLEHMDFVLKYTSDFVSKRTGRPYDVSGFRPAIEYRLAMGILRRDRATVRQASLALKNAFPKRAPDYTRARYLFWQTLAHLPFMLSGPLLQFAYSVNKMRLTRATHRRAGRKQKAPALQT